MGFCDRDRAEVLKLQKQISELVESVDFWKKQTDFWEKQFWSRKGWASMIDQDNELPGDLSIIMREDKPKREMTEEEINKLIEKKRKK